ncbi:MAG: C4-type zinc ribbon domain-containing protein [Endomicrobium sp.]|jgi:predicted  nucleic acid-binding Zn-ribbon protein|nr:C4-type zinc ribbon domain-containing protein [Endomicrobium sp.]
MINLKQELELLYQVQVCDIKIDSYSKQITDKLNNIKEKQTILNNERMNLNIKKNTFLQLVLNKKSKELELLKIEQTLNKYLTELNNVKSNMMYKTLLSEIDKSKLKKSILEDEIIELMYKVDNNNITFINCEHEYVKRVQDIDNEINEITTVIDKLKQELKVTKQIKKELRTKIKQAIIVQYDKINSNHHGNCVCLIKENSCSGCGMILRPQLINQVEKYKELIFCDNCSGILIKL